MTDAHLLPRYRQPATTPRRLHDHLHQLDERDQQITAAIIAGPLTDDPLDRRRRGIPIIGGVSGTQPGSDPLTETLRNDHRRRYA